MENETINIELDPAEVQKALMLKVGLSGLLSILAGFAAWYWLKRGFWGIVLFVFIGGLVGSAIANIINSNRDYEIK